VFSLFSKFVGRGVSAPSASASSSSFGSGLDLPLQLAEEFIIGGQCLGVVLHEVGEEAVLT
jgi:hypothetical protein